MMEAQAKCQSVVLVILIVLIVSVISVVLVVSVSSVVSVAKMVDCVSPVKKLLLLEKNPFNGEMPAKMRASTV